jgi:cysteine desulfurase
MKTIYLDHAASTPLREGVLQAMLPYLEGEYGNPSSLHHRGRKAHGALLDARSRVAEFLQVKAHEVIFTGGGTEANNLALFGVAYAYANHGKHILVSQIEHPSILSAAEKLSAEGFNVEYVPVDVHGQVSTEDVLHRVRKDTILISIMYANNEIGTVQPIQKLSKSLEEIRNGMGLPFLHTDACQATGQLPVSPSRMGVNLMTLNSSKAYGPKGVGMLYVKEGVKVQPQLVGGAQERGMRSGTENVAGIVGFAYALQKAIDMQALYAERLSGLRDLFVAMLLEALPQAVVNGHRAERLPNNVHVSLPYIEGEALLLMLDTYGICASTGSACSTHNLVPSHVLRAIGQSHELIHGSLRFTLGESTTEEELIYTARSLKMCAERLMAISPLPLKTI